MTNFVKGSFKLIIYMISRINHKNYAPGRGEGETTRGVYDGIDVGPCLQTQPSRNNYIFFVLFCNMTNMGSYLV